MTTTRRRSLALLLALTALTLTLLMFTRPAAAEEWSCWDDPTLVVGGQTVHLTLGVPAGQRHAIHGSTLVVTVPANVSATLSGTGATNFPLTVTIERRGWWSGQGSIPVAATAVVHGPPGVPAAVREAVQQRGGDGDVRAYRDTAGARTRPGAHEWLAPQHERYHPLSDRGPMSAASRNGRRCPTTRTMVAITRRAP